MKTLRSRRRRYTNKMLKKKEKKGSSFSRRKHRRHRRHRKTSVSSWNKHYTYESNIINSEVSKSDHKDNNDVQAVNGLKDFLQGKR
jgi:hypothetical protein